MGLDRVRKPQCDGMAGIIKRNRVSWSFLKDTLLPVASNPVCTSWAVNHLRRRTKQPRCQDVGELKDWRRYMKDNIWERD